MSVDEPTSCFEVRTFNLLFGHWLNCQGLPRSWEKGVYLIQSFLPFLGFRKRLCGRFIIWLVSLILPGMRLGDFTLESLLWTVFCHVGNQPRTGLKYIEGSDYDLGDSLSQTHCTPFLVCLFTMGQACGSTTQKSFLPRMLVLPGLLCIRLW